MNKNQRILTFVLATVLLVGLASIGHAEPGPQPEPKPEAKTPEKKLKQLKPNTKKQNWAGCARQNRKHHQYLKQGSGHAPARA